MSGGGHKYVVWGCLPYVWPFCTYPVAAVWGRVTDEDGGGVADLSVTVTTTPLERQFEVKTTSGGYFWIKVPATATHWEALTEGSETYGGSRASGTFEHEVPRVPPWGCC